MKLSEHFSVRELVDPETVDAMGEERAGNTVDPRLIMALETLRAVLDCTPIIINDYEWGGNFKYSGVRPCTYTKGAKFSSHRYGNTADLKFPALDPIWVQHFILEHEHEFPHIVRMEDAAITKTWLHIECGDRSGPINVFQP